MPYYEYRCLDCRKRFTTFFTYAEYGSKPAVCPHCHSTNLEWVETSGKGKLAGFTVVYIAPTFMVEQGYGRDKPYVSGIVELEEGVKISARITGFDANGTITHQQAQTLAVHGGENAYTIDLPQVAPSSFANASLTWTFAPGALSCTAANIDQVTIFVDPGGALRIRARFGRIIGRAPRLAGRLPVRISASNLPGRRRFDRSFFSGQWRSGCRLGTASGLRSWGNALLRSSHGNNLITLFELYGQASGLLWPYPE